LSEYAKHEWNRIGPELHRLGLLTVLDETTFAAYCSAYGTWCLAEELLSREDFVVPGERHVVANPLQRIAREAARDLIRFGGEFALTPSSRARAAAGLPPIKPPSKFGDLLT
jgi:P27 family predicted phage terminase small subunit